MSLEVEPASVARFGDAVVRHLGLGCDASRAPLLRHTLEQRAEARGLTCPAYVDWLESTGGKMLREEIAELAAALTVTETYFFRNAEQIRAFRDLCLDPSRPRRDLRILSAGCASGEEAHSLAIAALERWPDAGLETVSILGVDLNPRMLARARTGRYSAWSLRETPAHLRQRWFRREGADSIVDDRVRSLVTFEERNLAGEAAPNWPAGSFDAIFFRNVLMYFTVEKARSTVAHLTRALRPGGLLFLGYAETLRNLSADFHLRNTHDTFYYQLRGAAERAPRDRPSAPETFPAALRETVDGGAFWVDVIRKASERVGALSRTVRDRERHEPKLQNIRDLTSVLALIREERFQDALTLLSELPDAAGRDPDVLQLTATLLVHAGRRIEAERVAGELLRLDDLNVGAHYVLALCSEHAGERDTAVQHNRSAIHLDPSFSMAHVHLGILAKRANRRDEAKREFSQALELIAREDTSRLLLFGGGFGRDALLAFCRNEMTACGWAP